MLTEWGSIAPESAEVEVTYARERKPKVLGRAPLLSNALWSNPDSVLLGFDRIFAIDTNTRAVRGIPVSATGVVLAQPVIGLVPPLMKWAVRQSMEHRHVDCPPERLGWKRFLELVARNERFTTPSRVGLIVDSDLDSLRAFNERTQPILDDVYLPANVTMLYASSDGGSEYMGNHLIRVADRAATLLLDQLEERGEQCLESQPFAGDHATYFRMWTRE
jgi:hypothetical protein